MRTATGAPQIERPGGDRTKRQWQLGSFVVLSCAVLTALALFAQQPLTMVSIRPTGPMPSVNVP